jgi:hypothetical protein
LPSTGDDTMNSLLKDLENIGHDRAEFVDGLNVQLLDFQLQSLKWALERETVPGGIQTFFWPKLPSVAEPNTEIYYNPILGRFRKDTPKLIRGGFICEEVSCKVLLVSYLDRIKISHPHQLSSIFTDGSRKNRDISFVDSPESCSDFASVRQPNHLSQRINRHCECI